MQSYVEIHPEPQSWISVSTIYLLLPITCWRRSAYSLVYPIHIHLASIVNVQVQDNIFAKNKEFQTRTDELAQHRYRMVIR